jgi:hypothetical protein
MTRRVRARRSGKGDLRARGARENLNDKPPERASVSEREDWPHCAPHRRARHVLFAITSYEVSSTLRPRDESITSPQ